LRGRDALNHPNIQKFHGYSATIDKQLCTTNYVTTGFYKFPKSDLNKEMNERIENERDFPAHELHFIVMGMLHGLEYLHHKNLNHGDLRPIHVAYNAEKGDLWLMDRLNDPSPIEKVQRTNLALKKEIYMSPELYSKLQGRINDQKYDAHKNDTWAVGLIALQIGLKKSIQNIYNPNGTINRDALNAHLDDFGHQYRLVDHRLNQIVNKLLNLDESERYSASMDHKHVSPNVVHHSKIKVSSGVNESGDNSVISQEKGIVVTIRNNDGSIYSYIQTGDGRNVIYDAQENKFKDNSEGSTVVSSTQGNVGYTQYQRVVSHSPAPGIEIRRGSTTPNKSEDKVIRRSYVLQEGNLKQIDSVVENKPAEAQPTEDLSDQRNKLLSEDIPKPYVRDNPDGAELPPDIHNKNSLPEL
jgi:serine/threonine protein kinase